MARTPHSRPIERLADALQDCLNEAAERAVTRLEPRLDRMELRLDRLEPRLDRQDETLSKQNATLRLMWKQQGGRGKLPIDD